MKRAAAVSLATVAAFALGACGDDSSAPKNTSSPTGTTSASSESPQVEGDEAPSSSSSQGAVCLEFLLRIDDDPLGIKRLPDKFAELVDGDEPAKLQLREASCASCFWPVDVLFDGQGKMYLHTG